jgi:hypothetical protein
LEKISKNDFKKLVEKKFTITKTHKTTKNLQIFFFFLKIKKKKKKKKKKTLDHGMVPNKTMEAICYYRPR